MKKLAILLVVALYIGTLTSNFAQNNSLLSSVSGTITNEINGDSISDITVKAFNTSDEFTTISNAEGFYSMDILPGVYNISFDSYDYINDTLSNVELTDGIDTELNNILHPFPYPVDSVWLEFDGNYMWIYWNPVDTINNGLEISGYNVFRLFGFNPFEGETPQDGTPTYIGMSAGNSKTDTQLPGGPSGIFAYAVSTVYTSGDVSDWTCSQAHFANNYTFDINFKVQLCCEENNSGINIFMQGMTNPHKEYNLATDENGDTDSLSAVCGFYEVLIHKDGYQDIIVDSLPVYWDSTSFEFTMEENTSPPQPTNLTVDSKSLIANWNAPQQNKQSEYTVNQLDSYLVYLDGDQVAEVPSTELTYTFENLSYGRSYEALVRAKYGDSISGASVYNFESEYLKPISSVTSEYVYGTDFVPLYFIRPFGTIQSIPKGLTAFEIFNNDNLIETIEWDQTSDTIRFTQENMSAGDYVYSVKAIYNLEDYGFPGETGEALPLSTENIHVVFSGINDYQDNAKVSIYPNPSNKNITISSEKRINEIRIIDLQGKEVLKVENLDTEKCDVDVSKLKEGNYFVRIVIDNNVVSRKLLIAR